MAKYILKDMHAGQFQEHTCGHWVYVTEIEYENEKGEKAYLANRDMDEVPYFFENAKSMFESMMTGNIYLDDWGSPITDGRNEEEFPLTENKMYKEFYFLMGLEGCTQENIDEIKKKILNKDLESLEISEMQNLLQHVKKSGKF